MSSRDQISDKNFCFIIPNLRGGGAERILINLLVLLDERDYNITLYLGTISGIFLKEIPKGVVVKEIFPNSFLARANAYLFRKFGLRLLFKLYSSRLRGDFSACISFLDGTFSEFLQHNMFAKSTKKILVIHSSYLSFSDMNQAVKSPHYRRMKARYDNVDKIVCVSNDTMKEFVEVFGYEEKIRVIYNPLQTDSILLKSQRNLIAESSIFSIISIGSLLPVKGFSRLIEAINKVRALTDIPFRLNIVGDGHLMDELNALVDKYQLNDVVHLLGFQSNPYPIISSSDLMVVSSFSEGLPTVVCEAMVLGVPVLSTDVTGCREVLGSGEFGMLVHDSVDGLANGIKDLIEDCQKLKHYRKKALERSLMFDDKVALGEYLNLIN